MLTDNQSLFDYAADRDDTGVMVDSDAMRTVFCCYWPTPFSA